MTAQHIMIVAGETSGDNLGADLMTTLLLENPDMQFSGVGGPAMTAIGLKSIFPMEDIAVMGLMEILPRLKLIYRRIDETVTAILAQKPDALVLIDSPEFAHRVAARVKKAAPDILVIDYVAPTVWAWRPGRAAKMAAHFDHVLAVLPFEPRVFKALGGPPCSYVGHPAIENIPTADDAARFRQAHQIRPDEQVLAVLPGSRRNEVKRLMQPFGETVKQVQNKISPLRVFMPAVPHVHAIIAEELQALDIKVEVVSGAAEKNGLFATADAALVASGTVSLELALAGVPMIVAYQIDKLMGDLLKRFVQVPSVVLPNLIADRPVIPEFLMERCKTDNLVPALLPLLQKDSPERQYQLAGLAEILHLMQVQVGSPSRAAALKILELTG